MITTAYAIDKKTQIFPSKGIHGYCLDCGKEVISKCGTIVSHHFAHVADSDCGSQYHDHKTEWHQSWQHSVIPALPGKNVEVTIEKDTAIKRADLISNSGFIIEFQHSPLSIIERQEREKHYGNMLWVIHTTKENSNTWRKQTKDIRLFFNGDDDTVYWYEFISHKKLSCSKEEFIQFFINNKFFSLDGFRKRESRAIKRLSYCDPYYIDTWEIENLFPDIFQENHGSAIRAIRYFIKMEKELSDFFINRKNEKAILMELERVDKYARSCYSSLSTRDDAIKEYSKILYNIEESERELWLQSIYSIAHLQCKLREYRSVRKYNFYDKRNHYLWKAFCQFEKHFFKYIDRGVVTPNPICDTRPLPVLTLSSKRSIFAKNKELRRSRK